jgi:hypothetical protein
MRTRHDLRRQDRQLCEDKITVTWHDTGGQNKFAVARVIDISKSGIKLLMPEAPPLHSYVTLKAIKLGLLGNASVRYCVRTPASKYAVGAEFTAGLHWTPEKTEDGLNAAAASA